MNQDAETSHVSREILTSSKPVKMQIDEQCLEECDTLSYKPTFAMFSVDGALELFFCVFSVVAFTRAYIYIYLYISIYIFVLFVDGSPQLIGCSLFSVAEQRCSLVR